MQHDAYIEKKPPKQTNKTVSAKPCSEPQDYVKTSSCITVHSTAEIGLKLCIYK